METIHFKPKHMIINRVFELYAIPVFICFFILTIASGFEYNDVLLTALWLITAVILTGTMLSTTLFTSLEIGNEFSINRFLYRPLVFSNHEIVINNNDGTMTFGNFKIDYKYYSNAKELHDVLALATEAGHISFVNEDAPKPRHKAKEAIAVILCIFLLFVVPGLVTLVPDIFPSLFQGSDLYRNIYLTVYMLLFYAIAVCAIIIPKWKKKKSKQSSGE